MAKSAEHLEGRVRGIVDHLSKWEASLSNIAGVTMGMVLSLEGKEETYDERLRKFLVFRSLIQKTNFEL